MDKGRFKENAGAEVMMESAGERLKKIRLEKGLSLEEVHKKTKVHLNILKAIEGDSLTHLSPVYLQGFIKIYCRFLGVDPKDYILETKEAKHKFQEAQEVQFKPSAQEPAKKNMFGTPAKSPAFFKTASAKLGSLRPSKRLKKTAILVLAVVFVSLGLFKLGKFISLKQRNNLAQARMQKEQAPQRSVKTSLKTQAQESKPAVKTAASGTVHLSSAANPSRKEDIRLVIKARDNSWVTLKTDGKLVFHRVLEKGRSESWKAKERMDLSLGNAGVVELEVDGQIFSNLGRKGQALKNIVITKKGLDIGR